MKRTISISTIAAHLPRARTMNGATGATVSRQAVGQMLRNLDAGKNRERLTAALKACHLTDEGVQEFLKGYKTNEQ